MAVGSEILALTLVFVVHVVGGVLLVWALLDEESRAGWRRRWHRAGDEPQKPPPGPRPAAVVRPPLPLPSAASSHVRLREHGRAADAYSGPDRRPTHPPPAVPGRPARRS